MTHEYFQTLRIEELRLENFRSFENARLAVQPLTYLVGRNAAGKSNLLDAVEFMREALTDGLATAVRRRDGLVGIRRYGAPPEAPVGLAVVLTGTTMHGRPARAVYGFRLHGATLNDIEERFVVPDALDLSFSRRGKVFEYLQPAEQDPGEERPAGVPPDGLALPREYATVSPAWEACVHLSEMRTYQLSPAAIGSFSEIRPETNLAKRGENAADVVASLSADATSEEWTSVLRALERVCEGIVGVRQQSQVDKSFLSFTRENGIRHEFSAGHASAGTRRALGILLALAQQPTPSWVLMDEIEDSFHPGAFNVLLGELEAYSARFPIVLTTHSPEVLSHASATAERVRVVEWRDGASQIFRLNDPTAAAVGPLESVGDMLRVNGLGLSETPERFDGGLFDP